MIVDEHGVLERMCALLPDLGNSRVSPSAYDTACLAMLRSPHGPGPGTPTFPQCARWLLARQHDDGSWGGTLPWPRERAVGTLAAVVALAGLTQEGHLPPERTAEAIARGTTYLGGIAAALRDASEDIVAFELIFPSLLEKATALGLPLPPAEFDWLHDLRRRKLRLLQQHRALGHAVHDLEIFDELPPGAVGAQSPDGGFGCSPAATARVLHDHPNPAALAYLRRTIDFCGHGAVPTIYPFGIYDRAWVIACLQKAGVDLPGMKPHITALAEAWGPDGVASESHGLPPDGDDTAMVFTVLRAAGHDIPADPLHHFRTPHGYTTYPMEMTASASCNAHILTALRAAARPDPDATQCAHDFLRRTRRADGTWADKWHISPYYTTACAVESLHGLDDDLCRPALTWVLRTQHPDGSWGSSAGNTEETAYALTILLSTEHPSGAAASRALARGTTYLARHADDEDHPELWIGKSLYTPLNVVRGLILSTLWRCMQAQPHPGA